MCLDELELFLVKKLLSWRPVEGTECPQPGPLPPASVPAGSRSRTGWPKICIFGRFGPNIGISVSWLVGGCGTRAVFRKTPIFFIALLRTCICTFCGLHDVDIYPH